MFRGAVRTGPDNPSLTVYPRRGLSLLVLVVGIALVVPFGYVTCYGGSFLDTLDTRMATLAFACFGVALCFKPTVELFRRDPVLVADSNGIAWAMWAQPAHAVRWSQVVQCTAGRRTLPRGGWVSYVEIVCRETGGHTIETMLLAIRVGRLVKDLNALHALYEQAGTNGRPQQGGGTARAQRPRAREAPFARRVILVACLAFFPLWFGSAFLGPAKPIKVGPAPTGIAVTPDGRRAYVADEGFDGAVGDTVSVLDTGTNEVAATVRVASGPSGVAIAPDGCHVYVTSSGTGVELGTVSVIDTATNRVTATATVAYGPSGVAVTPDGRQVYVANFNSSPGSVSVIDTATNTVSATITLGSNQPWGVSITPDGRSAYVTDDRTGGQVGHTVSVIDTATHAVTASVTVGEQPAAVALARDGRHAYVSSFGATSNAVGTVSVIDTATRAVTATVDVGDRPLGLAVAPDGRHVFVANSAVHAGRDETASVSVIDTASNMVVHTVGVKAPPSAVAVTPDGRRAYVTETSASGVAVLDTGAGHLPPHGLIWL
ncbi:MAG TPA: YncE family protein [Pseudonocardia sp.]|nr:YncE family protein [Pseudonocardia sp.]